MNAMTLCVRQARAHILMGLQPQSFMHSSGAKLCASCDIGFSRNGTCVCSWFLTQSPCHIVFMMCQCFYELRHRRAWVAIFWWQHCHAGHEHINYCAVAHALSTSSLSSSGDQVCSDSHSNFWHGIDWH